MSEEQQAGPAPTVRSSFWMEEAEQGDAYLARVARCNGYDVYGEMLGRARWVEMLFLLFQPERPQRWQAELLEDLALALANPGPREASVHAAMCGGVCGSPAASSLMAALAVGAGQYGGAREVWLSMQGWASCGPDLAAWKDWFAALPHTDGSVWPRPEHPPGFDPRARCRSTPVQQTLICLARHSAAGRLVWLAGNLDQIELAAGAPLSMAGVAAAAFCDLGFSPDQAEMLTLLLRLPGAAAHALEQRPLGYKKFPFGVVELSEVQEQSV